MTLEPVHDLDDPRLADYRNVSDPALLAGGGIFIAEGRLVVRALLAGRRFRIRSLLVSDAALASLEDALAAGEAGFPIYVASKSLMSGVVGFNVHRGCLAAAERPLPAALDEILPPAEAHGVLLALERVSNADNIGGIFRNAAAFGVDGVLLSPGCCDPLYRKAVRVSIGGTLSVPFAYARSWPEELPLLRESGFMVLALTPAPAAVDIDREHAPWAGCHRLAVVAGTEGSGLTEAALRASDCQVRIPMAAGADSLNVATAVGIALHRLSDCVRRATEPATPSPRVRTAASQSATDRPLSPRAGRSRRHRAR